MQGTRGHGREWSGAGEAGQWCAGGVFVVFFFFLGGGGYLGVWGEGFVCFAK